MIVIGWAHSRAVPIGSRCTTARESLLSSSHVARERAQPYWAKPMSAPTDGTAILEPPSPALAHVLGIAANGAPAGHQALARTIVAWLATPEQGLRAEIESFTGRRQAAAALGRLAPSQLSILAVTQTGGQSCWAEIGRQAGGADETAVIGLTLDRSGDVARLVWLRAPRVPAWEAAIDDPVAHDGRRVIERYFEDLMHERFAQAAAHFAPDTIYSHPPYRPGAPRVLYRGRDALRRGFVAERGATPARQLVTGYWQEGERFFVEGVIEGIPDGGTFVCTGQLTSVGEIARYVAFYSSSRIP